MFITKKLKITGVIILLIIVSFFAVLYNFSVSTALENAAESNREILYNYNREIIEKLSQTENEKEWYEIISRYEEFSIKIENDLNETIAETTSKTKSENFDIKIQNVFEFHGKAYILTSSVFFLKDYITNTNVIFKFVLTEFLISVFFLLFLFIITHRVILRPYKEFYISIEEYEKTGKLRQNRFKGYIGMIYDRFAEMTENLESQQNNQKRIIASISHDIKTPLTSIMGYTERLKKENISEERKLRYLETVYNKSVEIRQLVDEFDEYLGFKLEQEFNFEASSTAALCSYIKSEYADELEAAGIELEIINNAENAFILLDMQKIKRVFANIISNSVKHFNSDIKIISIEITEEKEKIFIKISDSGKGVEKEMLKLIFEPLYTSDKSRKVAGLGLAICKEIIDKHRGNISAHAASLGGLEIRIEFEKYKK